MMTKEKLSSLRTLRREITRTKQRIANLERQYGERSLAVVKTCEALENYLAIAHAEEAEIIGYISSIEDAQTRELFMLRYYDCVSSWQRIAFMAGEHDESYVRRKHDAYLKKNGGL